ncbi:MAG: SUMF1/EgtB/PvdO family nonheme iron enzyme [Lentisphaeria bacterium]|nr:SUMF1/EgtB/PvdO family nonheme iron enzyme [Lentisphaeria bacterium]
MTEPHSHTDTDLENDDSMQRPVPPSTGENGTDDHAHDENSRMDDSASDGADHEIGATPFPQEEGGTEDHSDIADKIKVGSRLVRNRYKVLECKHGGMGVVYKCEDTYTDNSIMALKTVQMEGGMTERDVRRMQWNFKMVHGLTHDHIVQVNTLEFDKARERWFLAMDWVDGEDLDSLLGRRRNEGNPLPVEDIVRILRQTAEALDYAHNKKGGRVIHRDVKCANIMVKPDGDAMLIDFGIAKRAHTVIVKTSSNGEHLTTMTTTTGDGLVSTVNPFAGTPAYQSPEQWEGKDATASSDEYSLAVTAYRCLSGHLPFVSSNQGQLQELVLHSPMPETKLISPEANAVLSKGMAKNPKERYESCTRFVDELERALKIAVVPSQPPPPVTEDEFYLYLDGVSDRFEECKKRDWERGQTFGEHLDSMTRNWNAGSNARADHNYQVAYRFLQKVEADLQWLERNEPLRTAAAEARANAVKTRDEIASKQPELYAKEAFETAERMRGEAERQFESGVFEMSSAGFDAAAAAFADAGRVAFDEHVRQLEERISESVAGMRFDDAMEAVRELSVLDDAKGRRREEEVKTTKEAQINRLEKAISDEVEQANFTAVQVLLDELKLIDPEDEEKWRGAVDEAKEEYIQELIKRVSEAVAQMDFATAETKVRDLSGLNEQAGGEWTEKVRLAKEGYVQELENVVRKAVEQARFDDAREGVRKLSVIDEASATRWNESIRVRELELAIGDAVAKKDFASAERSVIDLAILSGTKAAEWMEKVNSEKAEYVRLLESSIEEAIGQTRFDDAREAVRKLSVVDSEAAAKWEEAVRVRELEVAIDDGVARKDFTSAENLVGELAGLNGMKAVDCSEKVRLAKDGYVQDLETAITAAIEGGRFSEAEATVQKLSAVDAEIAESWAMKVTAAKGGRVQELDTAIMTAIGEGRFTDAFGMLRDLDILNPELAKKIETKLNSVKISKIGLMEQSILEAIEENRFVDAKDLIQKMEVLDGGKAKELAAVVQKSKESRIQELRNRIAECVRKTQFAEAREMARQLAAIDEDKGKAESETIQKASDKLVGKLLKNANKALRRSRFDDVRTIVSELSAVDAEEARKLEEELTEAEKKEQLSPKKNRKWLWAVLAMVTLVCIIKVTWRGHVLKKEATELSESIQEYYVNEYNQNWTTGQTVGTHIADFKSNYEEGMNAWAAKDYGAARDHFRKAEKERAWFVENIPLRDKAFSARQTAMAQREKAQIRYGKTYAADLFKKAETSWQKAEHQYEAADFKEAAISFGVAGKAFGEAAEEAEMKQAEYLKASISENIGKKDFVAAESQIRNLEGLGEKYRNTVEELRNRLATARKLASVSEYLTAAKNACQSGNWQEAQRKAEETLKLDPDNAEAKEIKVNALEQRILANINAADFPQAENLIRDLEVLNDQKARDMRKNLADEREKMTVNNLLKAAREALDRKEWQKAQHKAGEVLKLEADNAEAKVIKVNALEQRILANINAADFPQAEDLIRDLEVLNDQKAWDMRKNLADEREKMTVNNLLKDAREALDRKEWQVALEKADDVLKKVPNHEEAKEIRQKAEANLHPVVSFKAMVGEQEVNASFRVDDGNQTYWTHDVHFDDWEKGRKYRLTFEHEADGKKWESTEMVTPDRDGPISYTVILKEKPSFNGTVILPGCVELKMVKVEKGSFQMGSNDGGSYEKPVHKVTLTKDFWLGETEITQSQYEAVMGENPSFFKKGGDHPVEEVSWNEAMEFCKKLTEQERSVGRLPSGYEFSLPTEAQWEYAARGGGKSKGYKFSGSDNLGEVGWYWDNSGNLMHPVKQKKPNELGLYDMSGNVWEWCRDYWWLYPTGAVVDPWCRSGSAHVIRGGSWDSGTANCRSSNRNSSGPSNRYGNLGFRLALVAVDSSTSASSQPAAPKEFKTKVTANPSATEPTDKGVEYKTINLPGGVELKMVKVEKGSFQMGSNDGRDDEKPVHKVTLTQDFWIGETEITQSQYEAVMGENPSNFNDGGDYPVERVSWYDAMAFCRKLTELERRAGRLPSGYEYSLPTEAQWEYAARGGGKSKGYKYSGGDKIDEIGWYGSNSNNATHPIRQKKPNELGLYDMSGNVWEWCRDSCEWKNGVVTDTYRDGVVDPWCRSGSRRVLRGGGWYYGAVLCRSALRDSNAPSSRDRYLGFRVALVAVDSSTSASSQAAAPKESETKVTANPSATESAGKGIEYKTINLPGGVELKMVKVEKGGFWMGSNYGDGDEKPVHKVTLTQDFWMGETEITQSQYEAVMGKNPSYFKKGGNYPVEWVSWFDAMAFCRKLTELERSAGRLPSGYEYSLPTEAQWEYAARGGGKSKGYKYSGGDEIDEVGWYGDNSNNATHPVRQKKPNELGLYDMSGNVWEWCRDSCKWKNGVVTDTYRDGVVDPWCRSGPFRVLRGGTWDYFARYCRSADRFHSGPSYGGYIVGFRLALAPVQ